MRRSAAESRMRWLAWCSTSQSMSSTLSSASRRALSTTCMHAGMRVPFPWQQGRCECWPLRRLSATAVASDMVAVDSTWPGCGLLLAPSCRARPIPSMPQAAAASGTASARDKVRTEGTARTANLNTSDPFMQMLSNSPTLDAWPLLRALLAVPRNVAWPANGQQWSLCTQDRTTQTAHHSAVALAACCMHSASMRLHLMTSCPAQSQQQQGSH